MQAMVQDTYGSSEVMHLRDIDRPQIGPNEVLIRVRAAGVNPADWAIMSGLPYIARPVYGLRRPKIGVRGTDVAGTVEAIGPGVTRFRIGDEVFGWCTGSYAEYAAAAEDALAPKPANLSFDQAAAVPMAAMVALQALRDHGKVGAGHRVLVNGAAGGIGTFAVQIAKSLGAEVTGVCSTRSVELVRSIGADHVIDYRREDFAERKHHYDVILDVGGNSSLSRLRRALTPKGKLVITGGETDGRWLGGFDRQIRARLLSPFVGQTLTTFISPENYEDMIELKNFIEAGAVRPVIDRTFPLSEVPEAIRYLRDGRARGKVVITV
jgi:NADPH:quinone reductase-like Zn-dependent oxidoreductase